MLASGAAKNERRSVDWIMRWPAQVKSGAFFVTTTACEDETSEGNPENSKRDAVNVAPSVPALDISSENGNRLIFSEKHHHAH